MKFLELVIIFISKSCGVNSAVFVTSSDLFDVFLGFKFMFSSSSGLDFQWKSRPIIKRSTLPASWSTRTMRKFVGTNVIHEIIMIRLGKIKRIHIHIHSSKFTISHLNLAMLDPWAVDHVDPESPLWLRKKGGSTGVHQGRSLVALITQRISSAPPQQVMAGASLTGTKGTGPLNWSWELRGPTWSNRNPPTRSEKCLKIIWRPSDRLTSHDYLWLMISCDWFLFPSFASKMKCGLAFNCTVPVQSHDMDEQCTWQTSCLLCGVTILGLSSHF